MNVRAPIVFRAAVLMTSNYKINLMFCQNPLLVCSFFYKIARDMDQKGGAHYTQG